jgi:hypothetical protein
VTSRIWGGRDRWRNARRADGPWADVRAYDADDLETWLERAPSVHYWAKAYASARLNTAAAVVSELPGKLKLAHRRPFHCDARVNHVDFPVPMVPANTQASVAELPPITAP